MRARNDGRQPCERRSHVPTTPYPQPGASLVAPLPAHPCPALRPARPVGGRRWPARRRPGPGAERRPAQRGYPPGRRHAAQLRHPAGSLGTSLGAFASQSGLLLSFDPALTRGRTAPALKGRYSVLEGLQRVLSNTGLQVAAGTSGAYLLVEPRMSGEAPADLSPVVVSAAEPGRSAEGNLYRAALVGVPLQRRHRPLRPGFRG